MRPTSARSSRNAARAASCPKPSCRVRPCTLCFDRAMRTRILAVLTLALVATAGALYLTLTSDHEENAVFLAAIYLVVVWAFIATGLVAWARRPANKFGPLMATVGFAFMLGALSESGNEYLFAVGEVLGGLGIAVFVHALLAFPRG